MMVDFTCMQEILDFYFSFIILIQQSKIKNKLHFNSIFLMMLLMVEDYMDLLRIKRQEQMVENNKHDPSIQTDMFRDTMKCDSPYQEVELVQKKDNFTAKKFTFIVVSLSLFLITFPILKKLLKIYRMLQIYFKLQKMCKNLNKKQKIKLLVMVMMNYLRDP